MNPNAASFSFSGRRVRVDASGAAAAAAPPPNQARTGGEGQALEVS